MTIALRAKIDGIRADYVADLSALRRRLFVGHGAAPWLAARNIPVPSGLLEYNDLEAGAIIVRLHRQQYLLIDGIDGSHYDEAFTLDEGRVDDVLVVAYEAAEIACGGPHIGALMAELCPMGIAAVSDKVWNATRLAHCDVALRGVEAPAHYRVVCSPADAQFLFGVLREVTLEREGAVLGFDDFRALLNRGERTT